MAMMRTCMRPGQLADRRRRQREKMVIVPPCPHLARHWPAAVSQPLLACLLAVGHWLCAITRCNVWAHEPNHNCTLTWECQHDHAQQAKCYTKVPHPDTESRQQHGCVRMNEAPLLSLNQPTSPYARPAAVSVAELLKRFVMLRRVSDRLSTRQTCSILARATAAHARRDRHRNRWIDTSPFQTFLRRAIRHGCDMGPCRSNGPLRHSTDNDQSRHFAMSRLRRCGFR